MRLSYAPAVNIHTCTSTCAPSPSHAIPFANDVHAAHRAASKAAAPGESRFSMVARGESELLLLLAAPDAMHTTQSLVDVSASTLI